MSEQAYSQFFNLYFENETAFWSQFDALISEDTNSSHHLELGKFLIALEQNPALYIQLDETRIAGFKSAVMKTAVALAAKHEKKFDNLDSGHCVDLIDLFSEVPSLEPHVRDILEAVNREISKKFQPRSIGRGKWVLELAPLIIKNPEWQDIFAVPAEVNGARPTRLAP